jgi:hypothetical protein
VGRFYGFKLHTVISDKGETVDSVFTRANVDDRYPLKSRIFHGSLSGKFFGDRGYLSEDLFEKLFVDGIHLITRPRKNMKNSLMSIQDKIYLRKRALIETVNDELKNICRIGHSRHRSFVNFICNAVAALIASNFLPKNHPSIPTSLI